MKAKKKSQRSNFKLRRLRDLQTKRDAKGGNSGGIVVPPSRTRSVRLAPPRSRSGSVCKRRPFPQIVSLLEVSRCPTPDCSLGLSQVLIRDLGLEFPQESVSVWYQTSDNCHVCLWSNSFLGDSVLCTLRHGIMESGALLACMILSRRSIPPGP